MYETRTITDVIDTEYKSYAMYVLENRALPSFCDGLKPTARKLLYAMLKQFKGKEVKVAELGSSISSLNYHHGEGSAMGAVVTLAADWNNLVPLFRGHGNFGSRLIQEAAAPRYIFVDLNQEFYKYFCDFEVCDANSDIDNPEPQTYLPIIPWVLVNGIEGIAIGFACKYMPHDPKDIAEACILELKGKLKDDHIIPVKFPNFKGQVIQESPTKVITRGIVERVKRNTWLITEAPWGYDREKLFTKLDKAMEKGEIQDFEDMSDDSGFKFIVKMDSNHDAICSKDPIEFFKLESSYTENYTALDEYGKIIIFNSKVDIIRKFVDYRLKKVRHSLSNEISKLNDSLIWLKLKSSFINYILSSNFDIKKISKNDMINMCINDYGIDKEVAVKLVSIPIYDMTADMIEELRVKILELENKIDELKSSNPNEVYMKMLKQIK